MLPGWADILGVGSWIENGSFVPAKYFYPKRLDRILRFGKLSYGGFRILDGGIIIGWKRG